VFDELDMTREAANASGLRHNFRDSKELYIPQI
jgi:predicted unusual protein kinase regulating ubiquinone biosynthesis (AarF/ABC1/UbiB family)